MRTFCVDARPGVVRQVLSERGIEPVVCEWDDVSCVTEVSVRGDNATKTFVLDLGRAGLRWWRGRPRSGHSDPTFAQAAQRILRREHKRRASK